SPLPVITFAIPYKTSLVNVLTARTKYNWTDKDEIVTSLLEVQKKLQIPGFYKAEKGVFRSNVGHVINEDFQFAERVNEIFHWIRSAGLYDLWFRQENDQRVKSFLNFNIERLKNESFHNAGSIGTVSMPTFIAYGWCGSIILLVVENCKIRNDYLSAIKFVKLPDAKYLPSGLNSIEYTGWVCFVNVCVQVPYSASHKRTVQSNDALANKRSILGFAVPGPVGDHLRNLMQALAP
ncbi:hypothetical protein Bhyg_16310, partial [Pseudolycoriella hygida]